MNNEKKFIRLTPFKMQVLQTFPFIDADFDAITNYELLCKVVEYLNITVDNVNLLDSEYKDLYDYVHDYFDNLDVQEEINNKLDDMAESGQLTDIIAQYLGLAGVLAFNTLSDMKEATNLVNGSTAKTLGYHSLNDGGMSTYKIRTITNQDVVDEMTLIALNNENLVAELIIDNEISPEQLGAYGDGIHDDTNYLQSVLTTGARVMYGKGKTYRTTASIVVPSNSYIDMNGATIAYEIGNSTNQKVFSSIDTDNVTICNGKIRTDYEDKLTVNAQVIGIYLGGTSNCEVFNMDIGNCGGPVFPSGTAGLYLDISENNNSDKNYVHDCVFGGEYDSFNVRIFSPFYAVANKEAKNNVVERCLFKYAHKSCVEIAGLTTHHNIVKDCEVIDCGTEAMDIDKTSYYNTIKNVIVHNCSGSEEDPDHVPFGGISIQHRDDVDSVSGYYSHDNVVENCIIENTVGCGFYTNTKDFKFINCVCKNALKGMFVSGITYPTMELPQGEIIGCELHGTNHGIQFNRPGNVIIDKCKIFAPIGIELISGTSYSSNVVPMILNSQIHHGNKGIYTQVKNINICGNKFYDDITPLAVSSTSAIFGSSFYKIIVDKNHFLQSTIRDVNIICNAVSDPSILLVITNNMISNSSASAKINVTGDKLNVGNFIGNSILPNINANLVIDKTYD